MVYSRGADQEDWLSKHKVFPSLYLNELCICIVMGRSYFRAEEEEKMRFSDQIDPGSGALRNWQAASESLLFEEPGSTRRAESGARVRGPARVFD